MTVTHFNIKYFKNPAWLVLTNDPVFTFWCSQPLHKMPKVFFNVFAQMPFNLASLRLVRTKCSNFSLFVGWIHRKILFNDEHGKSNSKIYDSTVTWLSCPICISSKPIRQKSILQKSPRWLRTTIEKPTDYVNPYRTFKHFHKIRFHLSLLLGSSETL